MKKKILMVTSYGFNARMRNFIEYIIARTLAKNGWGVFVIARAESKINESYIADDIKIFKTQNPIIGFLYILKIILFERPDIIHIFNQRNNPLGIITSFLNKIFRIPSVFTEYGLLHDHYIVTDRDNPFPLSEKFNKKGAILSFFKIFRRKGNLKNNFKNYLFHLPLSSADKIVFISKHNIGIAKEMGLENTLYLPHIFDENRWSNLNVSVKSKSDKINSLMKSENKNMILFIGQMKLRKGWDIIVEAMSHIDKKLGVKLIFVSGSSEKEMEELTKKVDEYGVRDFIIYTGKVEGEDLKKIYNISKLVIMPSRYEGFGLPVVEAWEAQKPIIASDVIAINEHVKNNYNGLLVPPENPELLAKAIEKLIKDDNFCEKLVKGGIDTLNELKSQKAHTQWLDFYEKII